MTIDELMKELENYKSGETSRSYDLPAFSYENDYIACARLDDSNKWIDDNKTAMIKTWTIVYHPKKDFQHLPNFIQLKSRTDIDIKKFTPKKEKYKNLKDCYGIKIYGMKQKPNEDIIRKILDFIFLEDEEESN